MLRDIRYAIRTLKQNPGFAAAAILIVALGIGVTTAIFSVVYSVVLQPLPYAEPDRLVRLRTKAEKLNFEGPSASAADIRDLRRQNTVFEDLAMVRTNTNLSLTGEGEPERLNAVRVTPNLFSVLGTQPIFGRAFREDEDQEGKQFVVLLSDGLWKRRFGGDRNILGRTIRLNSEPYTIVGVMDPDFRFPGREFELWVPLVIGPDEYRLRRGYDHQAIGRLKSGIELNRARTEVEAISGRLAREYPETNEAVSLGVVPMLDEMVGPIRNSLYVLFAAVGFLLLIGCANLANLLLARTVSRSKEFHLRAALGARTAQLVGQSIAELIPIVIAGGIAGLLVAEWGLSLLVPLLPATMPRVEEIRMSGPEFLFAASVLVLTAVIVGALPALQVRRQYIAESLHDSFRGSSAGTGRAKAREIIVVSQIAMSVVLLISAGLLVRSYTQLMRVNPGFRANNVLSVLLAIPRSKYAMDRQVSEFCANIIEAVRRLPGVQSVAMVNRLPLGGVGQNGSIEMEGIAPTPLGLRLVDWRTVTPDYFQAMGIPLKKGRFFTERDTADAKPVGIIDERVAEIAWPNQDPIGKRFRIPLPGLSLPWFEIVGVVGHIRHDRLAEDQRPQIYWNYWQRAQDRMALVVKTSADPKSMTGSTIGAIRSVDPDQPVYDVRPMTDVADRSLTQEWLNTVLLGIFAAASLLLSGIGIYGVTAFAVGERTREFAIRMALGAQLHDVVRFVLHHAALVIAIGIGLGIAGSWILSRAISALLFNVSATDWPTFTISILVLACIALLASYIPARRAGTIDPMRLLR